MIDYEWDSLKAQANLHKHGISFTEAVQIFSDDWLLTIEDDMHDAEQRFVAIGMDALGRILVVVFTYRGLTIRIISARKSTPREQDQYEEGKS